MKQTTLLDTKIEEYQIPGEPAPERTTGLMLAEPQPAALMEFREGLMSMSKERMEEGLSQYWDSRKALREWILSKLTEGLHYGYVPGCEPKYCDDKGRRCEKQDAWGTLGYKNALVPLTSWAPKPGLYDAGAALIRDLMWVYSKETADMETWEQLGKIPGHIVRKSQLFSRINDKFLGEGTGARLMGQKGGDLNNSVKMADKCARVAATITTWSLQDLFEMVEPNDNEPPKRPSPEADPNAATAQPRGERVSAAEVEAIVDRWRKCVEPGTATIPNWKAYVLTCSGREFDATRAGNWSKADFDAVDTKLKERGA